jgi:hypothetical protein
LQRRLNEAIAERDEGEAQKAAMAEILEVINASPGTSPRHWDAIIEKAVGLCGAAYGMLYRYDGEFFHAIMALRAVPAAYAAFLRTDSIAHRAWAWASGINAERRLTAKSAFSSRLLPAECPWINHIVLAH